MNVYFIWDNQGKNILVVNDENDDILVRLNRKLQLDLIEMINDELCLGCHGSIDNTSFLLCDSCLELENSKRD